MTTAQKYWMYYRYYLTRDVAWVQGHGWVTGLEYMNNFKLRGLRVFRFVGISQLYYDANLHRFNHER